MTKAKTPIGAGRITLLGVVLALTTLALGLVAVHDALVSADVVTGPSWIESTIDGLNGLGPQWWAVPVGVVMVVLGVWVLSVALRPRPRTAVALRSQTGVFLRPRDVKRLVVLAADDVDGVRDAKVSASRRAATVTVTVTGEGDRVGPAVEEAVKERLDALDIPPRLTIKADPGVAP